MCVLAGKSQSIRNWAMILTAFSHGLRASEVCNLKTSDVKDGHIKIHRLKNSNDTLHQLMPHRGQPLLDEVKALAAWLLERPLDAGDALFTSNKGGCMSATQFYRIFHAIAVAVNLPKHLQHPHVLKHTCVTELVHLDMNLGKVAAFVGHASISSTMRYLHIADTDASREAMATFQCM